jgi:hypothetical protein
VQGLDFMAHPLCIHAGFSHCLGCIDDIFHGLFMIFRPLRLCLFSGDTEGILIDFIASIDLISSSDIIQTADYFVYLSLQ